MIAARSCCSWLVVALGCLGSCAADISACGLGFSAIDSLRRKSGDAWVEMEGPKLQVCGGRWDYVERRARGDVAVVIRDECGTNQAMIMSPSGPAQGQYVWMSRHYGEGCRAARVVNGLEAVALNISTPVDRIDSGYLAMRPVILRCAVTSQSKAIPCDAQVLPCGSVVVSVRNLPYPLDGLEIAVDIALGDAVWSGFRRITPSQLGDLVSQSQWSMVGVTMERWSRAKT
jgi:hypothetical protein